MCGIVGYLGSSQAAPVLLSSLRALEYRGYDSAGVAIIENGRLAVLKAAGKLANLESLLESKNPQATVGIGHTRWATHGVPNDQNAHPHMDCSGTLAIVHNGIIENYQALRQELMENGHTLSSDTDTEVVAHLIEDEFRTTGDLLAAIRGAVGRLKGAYALGVVSQQLPEKLYAVNHHYSLAVGLSDQASYLASDSVAVCQYTNRILRLEQSEIAEITASDVKLYSFDGQAVSRTPVMVDSNPFVIDKQGYKHFLLKEIHEQPLIMRQTLGKYLKHPEKPVDFSAANGSGHHCDDTSYGVSLTADDFKKIDRILIVACGTAYHAGLVGKYILEELCGIPVEVEIASEMRGRKLLVTGNTLTIAVSQCGIDVSVAATETFVAQCACFYLLALHMADALKTVTPERSRDLKAKLLAVPALMEQILAREDTIRLKSLRHAEAHDMVFVGRGLNYPIALEGALKLKELSYINASGYAAGELKHGPIAVLDSSVPVITVLVPGRVYEKTLSNAQESRARNARMVAIAVDGDESAPSTFDYIFRIPPIDEILSPMV